MAKVTRLTPGAICRVYIEMKYRGIVQPVWMFDSPAQPNDFVNESSHGLLQLIAILFQGHPHQLSARSRSGFREELL